MNLFIVDDHDIFRQSLSLLLSQQPGIQVNGHFKSIKELLLCDVAATETAGSHSDDEYSEQDLDAPNACIFLDYHLPDENPIDHIAAIQKKWPAAYVVFLTGTRSAAVLSRILECPVQGVFHKSDQVESIVKMLGELGPANRVISPAVMDEVKAMDFGLTTKEFDVLVLLTQGKVPAQIADALCLSKRTIEKHKENIMRKTQVHNLAQLIELGHRMVMPD